MVLKINGEMCHNQVEIANHVNNFFVNVAHDLVRELPRSAHGANYNDVIGEQPYWRCCESSKMATLMNSSCFVFKISLLRNYRVKYYDAVV